MGTRGLEASELVQAEEKENLKQNSDKRDGKDILEIY